MSFRHLTSGLTVSLGYLLLSGVARAELTGDGARQEQWQRMPVLNQKLEENGKGGVFLSRVANYDPVMKYCQGSVKVNLTGPDQVVTEVEKVFPPFFLETDQIQSLSADLTWNHGFRYLEGSHRLELSCFGWEGPLPAPEASIPYPSTPCRSLENRCDLLCPSTDENISSCLNPGVSLTFSASRGLSWEADGAFWKVGIELPHNHAGPEPLSCSFIVTLPGQKTGSTTIVEKTVSLMSREVRRGISYKDEFNILKTAYHIMWDKVKVKGVCAKEAREKPFEFCHPGLRYECNFVKNIQD